MAILCAASVLLSGEPPPLPGTTQDEGVIADAVAPGVGTAYAARVPIDRGSAPWSLILALHGLGRGERQQTKLLFYPSLGLLAHGIHTRYVVLGIAAQGQGRGWSDADEPAIAAAVRWALARWPIDPRRVHAYGISHGAMRLGAYAPRHSELFAGVVAMSGSVTGVGADIPPARDLHWYLMHGDADTVVAVSSSRDGAAALKHAGFPVIYREFAGAGHIYPKPITDTCHADAIHWLETLRLAAPPSEAETAALDALTAWSGGQKPSMKASVLCQRLSGMAGAAVDAAIASGLGAADVQLRRAVVALCVQRRFGPASDAALCAQLGDRDASVRQALIAALGLRANWQDGAARDALLAIMQDKRSPAAERSACMLQLGANQRLQRLCAGGADAAATALAQLAAGTDAKLAAMASKALAGALTRGLDGAVIVPSGK